MTNSKRQDKSGNDRVECCEGGCHAEIDRRRFVKLGGAGLAAMGIGGANLAFAGPFEQQDTADHFIPVDKKLKPDWIASLFARGDRTWYSGDDLNTIGMPVGGICAGQVYLTGDGRLVYWGIFNQNVNSGFGQVNYKVGRLPTEQVVNRDKFVPSPAVDQGFAVRVKIDGETMTRPLDREGFPDVRFCGEYPLGMVDYPSGDFPVRVTLEAFSPFIPLNADDSALPATVLQYRLKNCADSPLEATIAGWLQNMALHHSQDQYQAIAVRTNRLQQGHDVSSVLMGARVVERDPSDLRPAILFADFENGDYGEWTVEGEAFGTGPARGSLPRQQAVSGFHGTGLVNSFFGGNDQKCGKLTSPEFTIERSFISFLVGGGASDRTAIRLVVDGQVVHSASGKRNERLAPHNWNVRDLSGKRARIEIVDELTDAWGHINVDQIEFRDLPVTSARVDVKQSADFGTMALSLLGDTQPLVSVSLPADTVKHALFDGEGLATDSEAEKPLDQAHRAALGRTVRLKPGEEVTITFVVSWCMPNMYFRDERVGNRYAERFTNAVEVAQYVAGHFERLSGETRDWHDTYYDSTLPYWLLDRLHSTVCNLATETCQWWGNGRFWAYEGCGCCHGTCGHVWNYEHALARLFPKLERSVREMQDFADGVGFVAETGEIRFRGEGWRIWAGDSQGGYILKAYREHLVSTDDAFLLRNWDGIRRAVEFLIQQDGNEDGLIEGKQHQTYDKDYYGANTMVGSLYLGALRAAEEMARAVGDKQFAGTCRRIFEAGKENSVKRLFNGEYFIQDVDLEQHPKAQYADGCLADQMFGQGWAHQVNLGYLYPRESVLQSLESVWKYCWAPDIGLQNRQHAPQRWFAYPGEAGLFTCTWPLGKHMGPESTWYRDEIWTGIEYQVANHMAYEGMLTESLVICRAVHDRYHPSKRNPFNEIECGDHYARALASWGVLLGLAGFTCHGPERQLGFAPRITPEAFRCAFTTADAWGTFDQQRQAGRQLDTISVKWGALHLRTISLELAEGCSAKSVTVDGQPLTDAGSLSQQGQQVSITLPTEQMVKVGKNMVIEITS